jgi:hypothetical protein
MGDTSEKPRRYFHGTKWALLNWKNKKDLAILKGQNIALKRATKLSNKFLLGNMASMDH